MWVETKLMTDNLLPQGHEEYEWFTAVRDPWKERARDSKYRIYDAFTAQPNGAWILSSLHIALSNVNFRSYLFWTSIVTNV